MLTPPLFLDDKFAWPLPPHQGEKIAPPPFSKHTLYASGIKSADFRIQIPEKTHDPPPYRLSEKWMTPPYAFIKNRWPPPIFCHHPPLKFMKSPLVVTYYLFCCCRWREHPPGSLVQTCTRPQDIKQGRSQPFEPGSLYLFAIKKWIFSDIINHYVKHRRWSATYRPGGGGVWGHEMLPPPKKFCSISLKRALFLHPRPEFWGKWLQFPAKCGPSAMWKGSSEPPPTGVLYGLQKGCQIINRVGQRGLFNLL